VIDLDRGWSTERLDLEPLAVAHAAELRATGYGKEAARGLVALLHEDGWTVVAHIHPGHLASQRVARGAGLSPTADVHDGEIRWVSPAAAAARLRRSY
jgi:RimJ/RimL family protein N-acetyltransferase